MKLMYSIKVDFVGFINNLNLVKMKSLAFLLFCVVLKFSACVSAENASAKNKRLLHHTTEILQEMKDSELEINNIYSSLNSWKHMLPENDFNGVSEIKSKFDSFTNNLSEQFADSVAQFRNGYLDDEALGDLIATYRNSDWASAIINEYLKQFTLTLQKVRLLNLFRSYGALFVNRWTDKNKILTDNFKREVRIVSIDLDRVNVSSIYVRDIVNLLEVELGKNSGATPYYIEDVKIGSPEVNTYLEGVVINSFPVAKTEYLFLMDNSGKVVIIDAKSYEEVARYTSSEIAASMVAIVNDKFYSIDTVQGTIMSTVVDNIVNSPYANWTHVGSFPSESQGIWHGVAVNNSIIYFVTYYGVLYSYDTTLRSVTKIGTIVSTNGYASLIVLDNILYIHKLNRFYSFDGIAVKEISTPEDRLGSGLFQLEHLVCRVGGNTTDIGFNPDPVSCYNPFNETWTVTSHINHYRRYAGITTTTSGTYIFGGWAYNGVASGFYLKTVEVFDPKTQIWSYAPNPLADNGPKAIQAVPFYF